MSASLTLVSRPCAESAAVSVTASGFEGMHARSRNDMWLHAHLVKEQAQGGSATGGVRDRDILWHQPSLGQCRQLRQTEWPLRS